MKWKLLQIFAILFLVGVTKIWAQTRVGAGLVYGTEIESLGINANSQFFVRKDIAIAPDIVYFLTNDLGGGLERNWFDINLNGHYYFEGREVQPYVLIGLNYVINSVDSNFRSDNNTDIGMNIGGGANILIGGNLIPFAEMRFVIGNAKQVVFGGGVRLNING